MSASVATSASSSRRSTPSASPPPSHWNTTSSATVALDRLGYDEAWFGEHHSGGYELIACPEIFIAAAAERTKHIKLGTGVVSLPYHHPLMVADRWVLLDHLTRGRVIFGTGPGALPTDAYMMGIDPVEQRRMMQESLEAILALFRAAPRSRSTGTPTGSRCATRSCRSGPTPGRTPRSRRRRWFPRPARGWPARWARRCCRCRCRCRAASPRWRTPGRSSSSRPRSPAGRARTAHDWRVLGIMHLADTREQAIEDCTYGLQDFANYFGAAGFRAAGEHRRGHASRRASSSRVRGQGQLLHRHPGRRDRLHRGPARAVRRLRHVPDARPRLGLAAATFHSYELFAREVIPHFKGQLTAPRASHDWAKGKRDKLLGRAGEAIVKAINEHTDELEAERRGRG